LYVELSVPAATKEAEMRRYLVPGVTLATLALGFILAGIGTGHARSGCSNATLNGTYSVRATGDVLGIGPFAAVGVFNYDGNGHVAATLVSRTNGSNGLGNFDGTYSVTPDCFASDTLAAPAGPISTHSYAVFDRGRGFYILNTTVGAPNVIIGEGRKQTGDSREE
jgi:hypothetical protein